MLTTGPSRVVLALGLVGVCAPLSLGQVIDSTWINDTSGQWTDATRWSTPDFPTARGPDRYRAIIDFDAGGPYTISLASSIDLDSLVFTSTDATIDGGGVGDIVVRTDLEFGDGTARAIAELMSEGTLRFTGSLLCEIDDTPLCHVGAVARKTGLGDISLTGSSVLDLSSNTTFTIESSGDFFGDTTARINNAGTLIKQSAGLTQIEDVGFNNTGTVIIEQGTLEITNPVLTLPSTLGPATYDIGDGAVLDLPGTALATNQADVLFRGPDSSFAQLASVRTNQGLVLVENGADVGFTPTTPFVNEGTLVADGAGSTITTAANLSNTTGTITLMNGGVVTANGPGVSNEGTVEGNGTVQGATFINNGLVSPGNSPGVLVTEDPSGGPHVFQQGPGGTLLIEIAGRTPGSGHDVLDVRGIALFDGRLELEFSPFSGEPQVMPGDQFEIVLADGLDGVFRDIELRGLGIEGQVDVFLNPGGIVVVVREVPAPGALALLGLGGLLASRRRR